MPEHVARYELLVRFDGETGEGAFQGAQLINWIRPYDDSGMYPGFPSQPISLTVDNVKDVMAASVVSMMEQMNEAKAKQAELTEKMEKMEEQHAEASNTVARQEVLLGQLQFDNEELRRLLATFTSGNEKPNNEPPNSQGDEDASVRSEVEGTSSEVPPATPEGSEGSDTQG